jgi:Fe-S-cluster containining protein
MLRAYSEDEVLEVVEVDVVPVMYLHHLSDPEMAQIYYPWGGRHYRLQTRFVNGSCVALVPGRGCALGESRPLICRVWPFWWRSDSDPLTGDLQLEVDGDCTMVTQWNMTVDQVLRELGLSESSVKRELLALYEALREHGTALARARAVNIPPRQLLSWMLRKAQLERHAPRDHIER